MKNNFSISSCIKMIYKTIVTKIFFIWQILTFTNIFQLILHAIRVHERIVKGIYPKRTNSDRPLTEDFPVYIANKSLFVFGRRSCYSLSCLSVATENERKSRVGDRPLGINPIALRSSRATECGQIIERIRSKKSSPLLTRMQSSLGKS